MAAQILHHFTLPTQVDCCRAHWLNDQETLIIFGAYELDAAQQSRSGGLAFAKVARSNQKLEWLQILADSKEVEVHQEWFRSPYGIMDLTLRFQGPLTFNVETTTTDSCIQLLECRLNSDHTSVSVRQSALIRAEHVDNAMGIAIDYKIDPTGGSWVWGDSAGRVHQASLHASQSDSTSDVITRRAHTCEIWAVQYHPSQESMYGSGADDCLMKVWDSRQNEASLAIHHPLGVTGLLFQADEPDLVYTGCFDDTLRVWDMRFSKDPLCKVRGEGGAWALHWSK